MDPLLAIALMRVEAALLRTCGSQLHEQRRGHLDPDMHQKLFNKTDPCAPLTFVATGCGGLEVGVPVPRALSDQVTVLGIPNARFWLTSWAMLWLTRERKH